MIAKLKYKDIVKPHLKSIAEDLRKNLEKETGLKLKVRKLTTFSDEVRIEFREDTERGE